MTKRLRFLTALAALSVAGVVTGATLAVGETTATQTFTNVHTLTDVNTVTYTVPTTTVTTTVTTSVPTSSYLFSDEFNGTTIDTSNWTVSNATCWDPNSYSCNKSTNVFQPGDGYLHLRTQRESVNYRTGGRFSGSWIGTYQYDSGWPSGVVKKSWPVPFRLEYRAKAPDVSGAWLSAGWVQNVSKSASEGIAELDAGEYRSGDPLAIGCHQHLWTNGVDVLTQTGGATVSSYRTNWHTFAVEAYADHTAYFVDGVACGTHAGVSGTFGLIMHNGIGSPNQWGTNYGAWSPGSTTANPGPWDLLVDYVHVTAL